MLRKHWVNIQLLITGITESDDDNDDDDDVHVHVDDESWSLRLGRI